METWQASDVRSSFIRFSERDAGLQGEARIAVDVGAGFIADELFDLIDDRA